MSICTDNVIVLVDREQDRGTSAFWRNNGDNPFPAEPVTEPALFNCSRRNLSQRQHRDYARRWVGPKNWRPLRTMRAISDESRHDSLHALQLGKVGTSPEVRTAFPISPRPSQRPTHRRDRADNRSSRADGHARRSHPPSASRDRRRPTCPHACGSRRPP
jgi:hypothetical protein